MTRSVNLDLYPDADYTPNDMGAPERSNRPEDWVTFEDGEIKSFDELEKLSEAELDLIPW